MTTPPLDKMYGKQTIETPDVIPTATSGEPTPFFFSSRSRHTSWTGDWSSDVCSSDLGRRPHPGFRSVREHGDGDPAQGPPGRRANAARGGSRPGRREDRRRQPENGLRLERGPGPPRVARLRVSHALELQGGRQ